MAGHSLLPYLCMATMEGEKAEACTSEDATTRCQVGMGDGTISLPACGLLLALLPHAVYYACPPPQTTNCLPALPTCLCSAWKVIC